MFLTHVFCSHTQPPSDQLSEEASPLQTPPTSYEPPRVDTKQPASQLGELPLKADDSQFFALGSGGMVVDDNPDLTLLAETPEEGSEVKELASDFQTFGEWRKKVLEEELERENEKVKKMAKGGSGRGWKYASWCLLKLVFGGIPECCVVRSLGERFIFFFKFKIFLNRNLSLMFRSLCRKLLSVQAE